jgi:signal transduction histidine kinase
MENKISCNSLIFSVSKQVGFRSFFDGNAPFFLKNIPIYSWKKSSLVVLVFLSFISSYSQNAEEIIKKLKIELTQNPTDSKKAVIYSDLTWYYANVSIDSALFYGDKAIKESQRLGDSILTAQVYSDLGAVYFRKNDFINAKKFYLKSYQIRKLKKDLNGLAKINNNLANIYMNTQEYKSAMKAYLETLSYFEKNNDLTNANIVKANIGQLYTDLRNYDKSVKYLKEALKYYEKQKDKVRLCESYLNLGKAYESMGDLSNAEFFYKKSLGHCQAIANKKATGILYQSLAIIQTKQSKDSLAAKNLAISDSIGKIVNSTVDNANLKITKARYLLKQHKYEDAKELLLSIKKVFRDEKSEKDLLYTYRLLIPTSAFLNQPDSVAYYNDKYTFLFEKLTKKSVIKQTNELETKYQTAKKEKLIIEKEAENKRKTNWIIIISLLTLFSSLVGFLIYRQQKLKNKQQEQEFQLKSAIAQIETQNQLQEQRLAISRDLHDNIGAQLTFVISSVDNLKYGNQISDNRVVNQLTKISDFTKSTIIELRDTIWAMNNNEFSFDDLRSRIFNFIEKAKSAKEDIEFKFNVDDSLQEMKFSSIIGINLYRTMQEAVNNAVKYAEPSQIEVNVLKQNNQIQIQIKDNGKGFDLQNVDFGNGLHNMKKRIEEVDGKITITSDDTGTVIEILI